MSVLKLLVVILFLVEPLRSPGRELLTIELLSKITEEKKVTEGSFLKFSIKKNINHKDVLERLRPFVGKFISENFILAKIIDGDEIELILVVMKELTGQENKSFMLNKDLRVIIDHSNLKILPTIIRDKSIYVSKGLSLQKGIGYKVYSAFFLIFFISLISYYFYKMRGPKNQKDSLKRLRIYWIDKIKAMKTRQEIESFYKEIKSLKTECRVSDFYFTDFRNVLNKYQYMRIWSNNIENEIFEEIDKLVSNLEEKNGI